jgi:hypothetical protein
MPENAAQQHFHVSRVVPLADDHPSRWSLVDGETYNWASAGGSFGGSTALEAGDGATCTEGHTALSCPNDDIDDEAKLFAVVFANVSVNSTLDNGLDWASLFNSTYNGSESSSFDGCDDDDYPVVSGSGSFGSGYYSGVEYYDDGWDYDDGLDDAYDDVAYDDDAYDDVAYDDDAYDDDAYDDDAYDDDAYDDDDDSRQTTGVPSTTEEPNTTEEPSTSPEEPNTSAGKNNGYRNVEVELTFAFSKRDSAALFASAASVQRFKDAFVQSLKDGGVDTSQVLTVVLRQGANGSVVVVITAREPVDPNDDDQERG